MQIEDLVNQTNDLSEGVVFIEHKSKAVATKSTKETISL